MENDMSFVNTHKIQIKVGNFTEESELSNKDRIVKLADWNGAGCLDYTSG